MKTQLILAVGLFALSGVALGSSIPRFDVEGHCEQVASVGGSSNMLYNSCIDMEQQAYDNLKPAWSGLPGNIQRHCTDVASVGGPGSYSLLESCAQMETEAANNKESFSFD